MKAVRCWPVALLLSLVLLPDYTASLRCYTCMGSNNEDCNRQGSKICPSFSDACAVVLGHDSGVMKTCSYKSFCSQANSQGYRSPGVRVHCCYGDDCNVTGVAAAPPALSFLLLSLAVVLPRVA
ncbi:lymphocyte antigen 6 family member pge [Gadus macrocephalus]|uniref:lymphocyte antigen 6 family member pge n=1 Tax=Gadus macrocephalus TaxID=80720 RepID=UPI0028CBB637|nr:lymphocyte antigen 6 family member pge [Gadus macrocephalus]